VPELPEAETIVRGLASRLPGRTITGVHVKHADVLPGLTPAAFGRALRGRRFEAVERRAKKVVLRLDDGRRLVVNLGMTGGLVLSRSPRAAEATHVAVRLDLDDGEQLLYDDARRFGRLELLDPEGWERKHAALGAEPLADDFTGKVLFELTQRSRTPIRNWLLDQRRVAGVGNIYAAEALFRAGIDPARPAKTVTRRQATKLRDALRDVLAESIAARGTTISDFRDEQGEAGAFARWLRVYGREDEPCVKCGRPIVRAVLANRSSFFCRHCQR